MLLIQQKLPWFQSIHSRGIISTLKHAKSFSCLVLFENCHFQSKHYRPVSAAFVLESLICTLRRDTFLFSWQLCGHGLFCIKTIEVPVLPIKSCAVCLYLSNLRSFIMQLAGMRTGFSCTQTEGDYNSAIFWHSAGQIGNDIQNLISVDLWHI